MDFNFLIGVKVIYLIDRTDFLKLVISFGCRDDCNEYPWQLRGR
jgi:hypothetical protein